MPTQPLQAEQPCPPRLEALKHPAKAREQVEPEPFCMVTGELKGDSSRAVYRIGQGTINSLVQHRDKLAVFEIVSGDRNWAAMQKGSVSCMSSRTRQGVRSYHNG